MEEQLLTGICSKRYERNVVTGFGRISKTDDTKKRDDNQWIYTLRRFISIIGYIQERFIFGKVGLTKPPQIDDMLKEFNDWCKRDTLKRWNKEWSDTVTD